MPDYIERKATVNKIVEIGNQNYQGKYPNIGMTHAANIVNCMPASDVAPVVHGRWSWCTGSKYRCTNCGRHTHVDEVMEEPVYNYCPYCGALMDGHNTPAQRMAARLKARFPG